MNTSSGSDITEGKVKKARLPNDAVYAADLAIVQAIAEGKSKIIFSALAASGTNYSTGDVWYQRLAGAIIAQWEFTAGAWASRTLDGAVVVNLTADKITTGTLSAGTTIVAGTPGGSRIELGAAGLRKYAPDGTTVQVDLTGTVAAFSGLITGSEIIAGTVGAARIELDATGLRQYAADGTTVLQDTADDAMIRARGDNTALGSMAQGALTTGHSDTAVGSDAQSSLTTGDDDTAVGAFTQAALTTGVTDTAVGALAQQQLTTGDSDTAVGALAQLALTTGHDDTAVGAFAQLELTTGHDDTAVGSYAQATLTTGFTDTAVGVAAQRFLTTGHDDTAVGYGAQVALTTGYADTAVGSQAQYGLTTGHDDTAIGPSAQSAPLGDPAKATTTASYQTSIGPETGQSSATQVDGITTVGYQATAGAANATSIGREARADHAGSIALGYQTLTTQTDQVMVGPRDVEITDTTKGLVLKSPDGTRYRVTVANGGALSGGGSPPAATDAVAGIVELATSAETTTGTDTARATTPADVKDAIDARTASDTVAGIVELATSAETITGTDTVRAVTPADVAAAIAVGVGVGATMGTPTTTSSNGTASVGTTETLDVVLGTYRFTAVAGVRYRAMVDGLIGYIDTVSDQMQFNIRNGGASTPTATSTLIATQQAVAAVHWLRVPCLLADTFVPGAGTVTLGLFTVRNVGTGYGQPIGKRELYVVNLGPA